MREIRNIIIAFLTVSFLICCNEEDFLEEEVFDFYSPENSFTSPEQIDLAVVKLYQGVHETFIAGVVDTWALFYTTDIAYDCIDPTHQLNSWADRITPETGEVEFFWEESYKIIANANTVLSRIENVEYASAAEKNAKIAEAKFFRAYAYRALVIMYGGVPLSLEELQEPKRDFTRASKADVLDQIVQDLTDAIADLPDADAVTEDGRISKGAANHLLSEIYIMKGDYTKAIAAASAVIDNPSYQLMTDRYGSRVSEPGDVYWDLFQRGNVNRGSGNTETIWASQYEHLAPGGGKGDDLARFLVPLYWQLKDNNGDNVFFGHSSQNGGRGIGWWAASDYMLNEVWVGAGDDMRNSEFNIVRDVPVDNPDSEFFGQMMVESGAIDDFPDPYKRWWSALFAKSAPLGDFPDDVIDNPETGATNNGAASSFNDRYLMRLAETFLLRAEAHLLNGDTQSAADDINRVRARANANAITAGEVDIDFILDERARELFTEEFRLLTLMRMGNIVERVRTYNPMHNGQYASNPINDTQNLWPIPNSEILVNTEAILEQNPGY
ncbi:Starch-binding associating with outer membrane [Zobellia uliginosa]|uniref:Starch-binding associating with outer membrane n=1 Tax=Zobellia uliginosa TaxID=143224 RepID=A0ABY1L1Z1_9FLAO|nr:RagB/SusD family nutrient uptake outer membrane protein [Zobellia uliginosa]SIT13842.1 Starch-binding associating with outer membrane [Zobellia uliginosa]